MMDKKIDSKQQKIVAMFDEIAHNYDLANRVLSFGIDVRWRKEACEKAIGLCEKDSLDILDVACGTGDMIAQWLKIAESCGNSSLGMQSAGFANEVKQPFRTCENFRDFADSKSSLNPQNFHKYKSHTANTSIVLNAKNAESQNPPSLAEGARGWVDSANAESAKIGRKSPSSEVLCENNSNEYPKANCPQENAPKLNTIRGIDPSNEMLKIAAQKLPPSVILQNGEAKDLRVDSDSVDILSIAYGLRNVVEVDSALKEFHRVLRKNGILVILEFSKKDNENIFDKIARFYTKRILPYIGGFISKNYAAYKYLPNSVDGFLSLEQIAHKLQNLGFSVKFSKRYFCNVCSLIIAQKDSAQN